MEITPQSDHTEMKKKHCWTVQGTDPCLTCGNSTASFDTLSNITQYTKQTHFCIQLDKAFFKPWTRLRAEILQLNKQNGTAQHPVLQPKALQCGGGGADLGGLLELSGDRTPRGGSGVPQMIHEGSWKGRNTRAC